jgi:hypothetical protein
MIYLVSFVFSLFAVNRWFNECSATFILLYSSGILLDERLTVVLSENLKIDREFDLSMSLIYNRNQILEWIPRIRQKLPTFDCVKHNFETLRTSPYIAYSLSIFCG